jgi:hypothetical protein
MNLLLAERLGLFCVCRWHIVVQEVADVFISKENVVLCVIIADQHIIHLLLIQRLACS